MSLTTDDEAKLNKLSNVSNKDVKIFINEMIKYFKDLIIHKTKAFDNMSSSL